MHVRMLVGLARGLKGVERGKAFWSTVVEAEKDE